MATELNDQERNLILTGLYHLSNANAAGDDTSVSEQIQALVQKLGGDPDEEFYILEHS